MRKSSMNQSASDDDSAGCDEGLSARTTEYLTTSLITGRETSVADIDTKVLTEEDIEHLITCYLNDAKLPARE